MARAYTLAVGPWTAYFRVLQRDARQWFSVVSFLPRAGCEIARCRPLPAARRALFAAYAGTVSRASEPQATPLPSSHRDCPDACSARRVAFSGRPAAVSLQCWSRC